MENDDVVIERFLDAMWMERGLSENTLASYRNDLTKLMMWMKEHKLVLESISADDLQRYQQWLFDQDYKQTSRARMVSAIRRVFQYLHREKNTCR